MKKLHRHTEDRKLAGVCAGLAEYFDMDPLIFRVVFLMSVFFGGIGLLVYAIMWIMVPAREGAGADHRLPLRLHLSLTDKKLGGVCGGLGEVYNVDPVLFRVGFVLLGFVCGVGIVLYIALWMLLPRGPAEAESRVTTV
jgi:phage shock protein PspC (stress-responsive transcriptional regulator)